MAVDGRWHPFPTYPSAAHPYLTGSHTGSSAWRRRISSVSRVQRLRPDGAASESSYHLIVAARHPMLYIAFLLRWPAVLLETALLARRYRT